MLQMVEKLNLRLNRIKNPVTRNNKRSILNKFFEVVGHKNSYDEYDAMQFFDWAEQHYKGTSISQVYQVVKWFYKSFGFEFGDIPSPDAKYEETTNVPLPKEDVIKLIRMRLFYPPHIRALVALSTTYGMRAKEMLSITPDDIQEDRIFVRTAKSGRDTWRWMYLPEEIRDVVSALKEAKLTRIMVFQAFHFV